MVEAASKPERQAICRLSPRLDENHREAFLKKAPPLGQAPEFPDNSLLGVALCSPKLSQIAKRLNRSLYPTACFFSSAAALSCSCHPGS